MEKKNMVLLTVIAVATLLVAVVGATFAYFATTTSNAYNGTGDAGSTSVTAATITNDDKVSITTLADALSGFTTTDVYPGHMEALAAQVTAVNANEVSSNLKITFNVTENGFATGDIKVTLYTSTTSPTTIGSNYFGCTQVSSEGKLYEECANAISGVSGWTQIGTTTLTTGTTTAEYTLADNYSVSSSASGVTTYFYVVVEFVNQDSDQTTNDSGKTLSGSVQFAIV